MRTKSFVIKVVIIITLLIVLSGNGLIQKTIARHIHEPDNTVEQQHPEQKEQEKLNVGELIIEHVIDAHEWHFMTLPNGKEVAIYLPMILFHQGQLYCFSSRHLYHSPEHAYQGFEITHEKVVYRNPDGTLSESKVYDFSITKVVMGIFISCGLLMVIFLCMASVYKKNRGKAPKGLWNAVEMGVLFVRDDIAKPSIGKNYEKYMPFLLTVFFFIFFNNLIGQIPGWPNVTGNIAVTLTLALFTYVIVTISGNRHYWKEIVNPDVPMLMKFPIPLMPFIEFIGTITKPFALTMRLFANVTAGHIVMLGFTCLIFLLGARVMSWGYISSVLSIFLSIFMYILELLIAFIQAFIFTLLSALYIGLATANPHHEENH
jgi:F-type H+-transporting ATPase subunit a